MRHLLTGLAVVSLALLAIAPVSLADDPHSPTNPTGQPSQSCQAQPSTPGQPSQPTSSPGSPFNLTLPGHSTTVYAGAQPQNSKNPKSVAQYDVACFQVSSH
jgi:hypothetical protein